MNPDTAICPYCDKEFHVVEYGYRTECPLCGGRIDVFPEDKYYIDTPWGMIGISSTGDSFFMKPVLSWLIKKAAQGKEKLKVMGK